MGFTAILRRSASMAARLVRTQRQSHHCAALFSKRATPHFPIRHFSSASSDKKLLDVLRSEVDVVLESDDFGKEVEVPSNFPFTIKDNVGESTVTLTREYQGETITVEVSMPLTTGEEGEEDDKEDDGDSENASMVPLLVTVAKSNGMSLEFDVSALPDEIRIQTMSLCKSENAVNYQGPEFMDLDENLQKAFLKYLEVRGIKPSATNFLHEYMMEKDAREYVRWLKDVKKFVQA